MTNTNQNNNDTTRSGISDVVVSSETQDADLLWQQYQGISKSKKIAKKFFYTIFILVLFILIILSVYIIFIASNPF